ncbi:uncharacterized protein AB675_11594 [Cyphellophora attinorum]|uniref:FAD/NAD(P)-binding domain-containing protein n=1 Tax=Cyphellophora attinorum TaxID=1664694 RepID=A0A0N1H493_9EURO|nr:uncharacterized protein AB675_11594 [Phialophora attinorum]KPI40093.1 hypothetical protein AB675_11594 [Phialophora attinorum]
MAPPTTNGTARRSSFVPQRAPVPIPSDQISFPQVYEDGWGTDGSRPDLERARIFLLRMAGMHPESMPMAMLRSIVTDPKNSTVPAIATAIQEELFESRHLSFAANPPLQCVRFILIKSKVHTQVHNARTREVMDFFFDPTLERDLKPRPSGPIVTYQYPAGRLKVCIVGGGPTALASAISLAEKGKGKVEVHMYERRWVWKTRADGTKYADYPPTARRRDQVVTLQDSVTSLLSPEAFQALFAGKKEPVPALQGTVFLHTGGMTKEELPDVEDFHVLLGADGAASWVRKSYFHGYENERGRSYALGLAFDRPAGLPWSQPLNVFLTLGQTRYLLNASDYDGRGYLNMQLTEEEWDKMTSIDGQYVHFGRPGCLRKADGSVPEGFEESQVFAPSENRDSPLWISILDGLKLFGFKEHEVINIVRIPIVVQAVKEGVQLLPPEDTPKLRRPHAIVAVAGDAAMTVHFWPGRGLNSGIKSGLALGDELVHALDNGYFIGMPLTAMKEYNDFILKLQKREHDKRSIPILNQSGSPETLGWLLDKANSVPDNVAIEWLIGAMVQIADRLQGRDDWPFPWVDNVEPQLRIVLRQLDSVTLKEMAVSFPWPTREMAGAEVLPVRTMKEPEKQAWMMGLWTRMRDETKKLAPTKDVPERSGRPVSSSRFEAPRSTSPLPARPRSPSPAVGSLRRSNATQSVRKPNGPIVPIMNGGDSTQRKDSLGVPSDSLFRSRSNSLTVPGADQAMDRARSPSPGGPNGQVSLGRMLTVHRKPTTGMLDEAMSLALFRMQEAT